MHLETTHTMMLHVWHTIITDIAVVLHVYSFNPYSDFSPSRSTPDPVLTPPGIFNSTITQHSTISARVSAGRIRVTRAPQDCNQSVNNECRTKTSAITRAGLTFLSIFVPFFPFFALCLLPLPQSPEKHKQTKEQKRQHRERGEQARLVVKD